MNPITRLLALLVLWLGSSLTHAQLTIDITKGIEGSGIPIAIAPFSGGAPEDITGIIAADLQRTGPAIGFDQLPVQIKQLHPQPALAEEVLHRVRRGKVRQLQDALVYRCDGQPGRLAGVQAG